MARRAHSCCWCSYKNEEKEYAEHGEFRIGGPTPKTKVIVQVWICCFCGYERKVKTHA